MKRYVLLLLACLHIQLLALEPYDRLADNFELVADNEPLLAPFSSTNEEIVSVKMVSEEPVVVPGKAFWVAFMFHMGKDVHLYWKNPGDAGQAPSIRWGLPPGFRVSDLLWPAPERIEIEQAVVYGYSNRLTLLAQIFPPQDLEIGSKIDIKATVNWFGCSTVCVPGDAQFAMSLDVASEKTMPSKHVMSIFRQARKLLPHDVKETKTKVASDSLEVRVHQDIPFANITNVFVFLEQQELIATNERPSWELSQDKKTLTVHVKTDKLLSPATIYPLRGVVAVDEEGSLGPKELSWNLKILKPREAAPTSEFEKKYDASLKVKANNVDQHLEELENNVWYRKYLAQISLFIKSEFAKILFWAFLGGIILNVMPCVLPVISIKLLHFVQLKDSSRMAVAKHGVMYSFGVLISFWVLSGMIYILQSLGHVVGWGFQLQEPIFVTILIIILFILALALFGVFEFGVSLAGASGSWEQSFTKGIPTQKEMPSLTSSFLSGVLATVVAAPCTGPLLGSAIGFAATLQPTMSFAIFSALGVGMAFPVLLVSLFPGLSVLLPKPGRWMVTFKQLMGFFMLATVLWLVWVLEAETQGITNLKLLLNFFILALGAWVYGNWCSYDRSKNTRIVGRVISILIVLAGSWYFIQNVQKARFGVQAPKAEALPQSQVVGEEWEVFSLPKLERYIKRGIPVFVDVTAKWCLTCQTNALVLESDKVKEAFVTYGVVKMKADWTTNDETITRYIRSLGRNGVPVYAIYGKDAAAHPLVLPELITTDMVIDALKKVHEEK